MKVLHLIDSGGLYGAEKVLLSLVKEQLGQGLEPMILSAGEHQAGEKALETEAKKLGLPVTEWRMKPGLNLKAAWMIRNWALANNYQLLHSHGFKFNVLLGMLPEKVRGVPIIATLHGYVHAQRLSKMWLYESLDRFAIRRMRGVVLVGEAMKKELPGKISSGQAVAIPNGLDISELQKSSLDSLDEPFKSFFDNHEPVILGVGRLSREKGFDRLVSAFSEFRKEYPKSGMIIVGEGKLRNQLEALIAELGIQDDVLMPGYCSSVPALFRRSQELVMPSLTEGLPITLLEAIALKVPVIASAVGEIPKVLGYGKGGELLSDIEPATIARAIEQSVNDKERSRRRVDWAYGAVVRDYSSAAMAASYLEFYERVLGAP
ncbi:glycosyltransferase [Marinobacter sp. 71-i]|uniref:Glycosyltransferase n=1 Tax=Marinobacter iranensis TaxID=2962607 RepID=A0ABT5YEP8_9GAMM|nr:glycosyltransferase [Marinobacter iranensis]MDF0752161.1 glycosyltransferase [Marinobacter iranensis]